MAGLSAPRATAEDVQKAIMLRPKGYRPKHGDRLQVRQGYVVAGPSAFGIPGLIGWRFETETK